MTINNGTPVLIRDAYTNHYRVFANKGKLVAQNTSCQQYTPAERAEYYDVEVISLITKKIEVIPMLKQHVKPVVVN